MNTDSQKIIAFFENGERKFELEIEYFVSDEFTKNNPGFVDIICRFTDPISNQAYQIDSRYEVEEIKKGKVVLDKEAISIAKLFYSK